MNRRVPEQGQASQQVCLQPYYVNGHPVFVSPDDRMWIICESHPETTKEIAVCRNVVSLSAQVLGHTAVWTRSDLRPSNSVFGP